jgi:hypothetical protein
VICRYVAEGNPMDHLTAKDLGHPVLETMVRLLLFGSFVKGSENPCNLTSSPGERRSTSS